MSAIAPISEGHVQFREYKTWYRIVGDFTNIPLGKFPVLMLHGGPGLSHDCLEPLEALFKTGRPVVFYDQLGFNVVILAVATYRPCFVGLV